MKFGSFSWISCVHKNNIKIVTGKSKQKKFPAENLFSAFDCFDWLRSWIEAADWSMVPKFKKKIADFLN